MYKCETHGCDKQQVVHAGGKTTYECQECDRERVRAFTRGFDKPAATGSGEPLCAKCNQPIRGHDLTGHRIELPTPPASQPTVTLGREQYDKIELWLNSIRNCEEACDGCRRMVDLVLALLRAAEQK